ALGGGHGAGVAASSPPATQPAAISAFAYRLEASSPLRFEGGLARVATQREFPVLAGMAIRAEQLDPGSLQAPHWHPEAGEVHYVMAGQGTATVLSPGHEHSSFDLRPGSVSFFPRGHYHFVHNTGAEPLRVLAAFTHEAPTQFSAGDAFGFVPKPILAQVLGVAADDMPDLPAPTSRSVVPLVTAAAAPEADQSATPPAPYTLNLDGIEPAVFEGGTVTNVRGQELDRLDGICFLPLYVEAGGVREPHWHPNAAELIYVISGEAEIGLVGPDDLLETFTIGPGDLAFFPMNWIHYVASIGSEPLDSIVYLSHAAPTRIDLSDMVGFLPRAVSAVSVGLDAAAFDALPQRTGVVVAAAPAGS
ncbi:MAG: cupin domain-containing protein, partial [Thermomicrobiales bacterium]